MSHSALPNDEGHRSGDSKLADLEDSRDVRRLTELQEGDVERLNRYLRARRDLLCG